MDTNIAPHRTQASAAWADRTWDSADGLTLHFRDYPGRSDRPPVVALHGLTRNARDSARLARRLAGEWRVLVPEMRGRGQSDYAKDSASYNPLQYVEDLRLLLDQEGIERFVAIGTSLGGLMTMLLAVQQPDRVAAAVLVDVGPVLEAEGLAAIRDYVGQGGSFATWMHAARALQELHEANHPDYTLEDWLVAAKRMMVLGTGGRIAYDYDMAIAAPLNAAPDSNGPAPDTWPAFETLAGRPVTLIRGELSQLLSPATVREMKRRMPALEVVEVPRTGHAPTLEEPESLAAIDRLLAQIA